MSLHATTLDTMVRQHGEAMVNGHAPMREGPLAAAVSRTVQLAEHLLHGVGHVLAIVGLALIATLSADAAHDLALATREGRASTGRHHLPSALPDSAASS